MSQTFRLVCHDTKKSLWIGQGWGSMTTLYSGEPTIMQALKRFLNEHRGRALEFVCSDLVSEDSGISEYEEYGE